MLFAVAQFAADADDKYSTKLLDNGVLTTFRLLVGVHLAEFFRMDEM